MRKLSYSPGSFSASLSFKLPKPQLSTLLNKPRYMITDVSFSSSMWRSFYSPYVIGLMRSTTSGIKSAALCKALPEALSLQDTHWGSKPPAVLCAWTMVQGAPGQYRGHESVSHTEAHSVMDQVRLQAPTDPTSNLLTSLLWTCLFICERAKMMLPCRAILGIKLDFFPWYSKMHSGL